MVGVLVCVIWIGPELISGFQTIYQTVGMIPPWSFTEIEVEQTYAPEHCGWALTLVRLAGSAFVIAIIEEFFWRGFVYGKLLKPLMSRPAALALGGLGFSLHHIIVLLQFFPVPIALFFSFSVGVGGVMWSLLMDRQKTLAGAWASHMVVDFGMLGIGYWLMFY